MGLGAAEVSSTPYDDESAPLGDCSDKTCAPDSLRWLAPPPVTSTCFSKLVGRSPVELIEDASLCKEVTSVLEGSSGEKHLLLEWLCGEELQMALGGQCSCRVVQKMLEVFGGSARDELVARLVPGTLDLYESPHGNHVLAKIIEVVPRPALWPIIQYLEMQGCRLVARHPFGSRVLERLVVHGTEDQLCTLVDQCIQHTEELSRHQFGNFVIQALLEHAAQHRREMILQHLLPFVPKLSLHRTACHVVQKALNYCNEAGRLAIAQELLSAESPSLVEVADSRYGSYVIEELRNVFGLTGPGAEVRSLLERALPELRKSPFFARVATTFGLLKEEG